MVTEAPFPTPEEFAAAVRAYLDDGRSSIAMADRFETMGSTPERWANGTAKPHKCIRRQVVEWIKVT